MAELSVKHQDSSVYHPESPTRTGMRACHCYCSPFMKLLGFSPAELVFGHTMRGPLQLLQDRPENNGMTGKLSDVVFLQETG